MKYIFVVFGATGDLATEKLFPAMFELHKRKKIDDFEIVGVSRRAWSDKEFINFVREKSGKKFNGSKNVAARFLSHFHYKTVFFDTCIGTDDLYAYLKKMDTADTTFLFYVSLSPSIYGSVFHCLQKHGLMSLGESRLIIEKPFGLDRESAEALNKKLLAFLHHDQIYRVDHYLGKTGVRMMMNIHEITPSLGHLISGKNVSSIRIRFSESHGIKERGASYDTTGAFRDVAQNHMLEMLAVLCVDTPRTKGAIAWHDARAKIIQSLLPVGTKGTKLSRGQYRGYTEESNVLKTSKIETAFRFETSFAKGDLKGIRVILEGGKKMPVSEVFVEIVFKKNEMDLKKMMVYIQPRSEINFEFTSGGKEIISISHDGDAYEHVLSAAISGRRDLFVGEREILAAWDIVDPITQSKSPLKIYDEKYPFIS